MGNKKQTSGATAVRGSDVYVGGQFTSVDHVPATNIARWNGSTWSPIGTGVNGDVRAIAVSATAVYAGGTFTHAGAIPVNRIAQWNGTEWTAMGGGVNQGSVDALALGPYETLYAGGSFDFVDGLGATNLARWNGTDWAQAGGGVDSTFYPPRVAALAFIGADLYVGGLFTEAGGVRTSHIAKWNGIAWTALGQGIAGSLTLYPPPTVGALTSDGNTLYAGGTFLTAGGIPARNLAQWDGARWSALGDGWFEQTPWPRPKLFSN